MEHKLTTSGSKTLRVSHSTGRLQSGHKAINSAQKASQSKDERCESCSEIRDRGQDREPFNLEEDSKEQNKFVKFPQLRNASSSQLVTTNLINRTKQSILGGKLTTEFSHQANQSMTIPVKNDKDALLETTSKRTRTVIKLSKKFAKVDALAAKEAIQAQKSRDNSQGISGMLLNDQSSVIRDTSFPSPERNLATSKTMHDLASDFKSPEKYQLPTMTGSSSLEDSQILKMIRQEQVNQDVNQTNAGVRRTLMNLEKLACTDAEMIQLQRKTIYVQQLELQAVQKQMAALRRNHQSIAAKYKQQAEKMAGMQAQLDNIETVRLQFETEKEENEQKWKLDINKYKKEISNFKVTVRRITQEMSRTNYANANILKQMALETGVSEPRNQGTQTGKSLITLTYLQSINHEAVTGVNDPELQASSEQDQVEATPLPKKLSHHLTDDYNKAEWLKYSRDTIGLGSKGIRNMNVGVQCDIKVSMQSYRDLQKHCIDLRVQNEKHTDFTTQLNKRIDRLLKEKEEVLTAFKNISKQSFSAYQILAKERQQTNARQMKIMSSEIDSLKNEKSILTEHFGESVVNEVLKKGAHASQSLSFGDNGNEPANNSSIKMNSSGIYMDTDEPLVELAPTLQEQGEANGPVQNMMQIAGSGNVERPTRGQMRKGRQKSMTNERVFMAQGEMHQLKSSSENASCVFTGGVTPQLQAESPEDEISKPPKQVHHERGIGSTLYKEVQLSVTNHKAQIEDLQIKLTELANDNENLRQETTQLQEKELATQSELYAKRQEVDQLEQTNQQLSEQIQQQIKELADVSEQLKESEELVEFIQEKNKTKIEALEGKIGDIEKSKDGMKFMYEKKLDELNHRMKLKEEMLETWQQKKEKAERELHQVRLDKQEMFAKGQAKKTEFEAEIKMLNDRVKEQQEAIDMHSERMQHKEQKLNDQIRSLTKQISELRQTITYGDMKQKAEIRALTRENEKKTAFYFDQFNKLHLHVSCLGCDQIKFESMKLLCGHNICRSCLNSYSTTEHPRSSVRCDVCDLETKVSMMSVSIPNRAIAQILLDCQEVLGRKFYSGAIRREEEEEKKQLYQASDEEERVVIVDYASRDPMKDQKGVKMHKSHNYVDRQQQSSPAGRGGQGKKNGIFPGQIRNELKNQFQSLADILGDQMDND